MIREFQLSTARSDEHTIHEPPSGILRVSVIGEDAHCEWEQQLDPDEQAAGDLPAQFSFRVSARSLLLALRAAWDDEHPGVAGIDRRRGRGEQPVNSHQPWTPELDDLLRDTWLAATPPATERIAELADAMGRSTGGIRSRLAKIGCDPDVPGRQLHPDEHVQRDLDNLGPV